MLIEGQDYYVHWVRFPNRANPAMVWENDDGTYDVYVNLLYQMEDDKIQDGFAHEMQHIAQGHFEALEMSVSEIERQAEECVREWRTQV